VDHCSSQFCFDYVVILRTFKKKRGSCKQAQLRGWNLSERTATATTAAAAMMALSVCVWSVSEKHKEIISQDISLFEILNSV